MKRYKKYVKYVNIFVTKIYNKGINYELCYVYNYIITEFTSKLIIMVFLIRRKLYFGNITSDII